MLIAPRRGTCGLGLPWDRSCHDIPASGGDDPLALLTALLTNNAAAVLVFPVALAAATQAGVHVMPIALALASSVTPIGFQTNLTVYGPGSYRAADYLRFGLPLPLCSP